MRKIKIVAVISNSYVVTENTYYNNVPFPAIIQFFFRVLLNVLVCTPGVRKPQDGNHCPRGMTMGCFLNVLVCTPEVREPQVGNHCPRGMTMGCFNRFDQCSGHCPNSVGFPIFPPHLKTETDSVSETLLLIERRRWTRFRVLMKFIRDVFLTTFKERRAILWWTERKSSSRVYFTNLYRLAELCDSLCWT